MADKKRQKRYTKEFKIEAVKLLTEKGMKASDVARDLGMSQPALGAWIKDFQRSGQEAFPGKGNLSSQEDSQRSRSKVCLHPRPSGAFPYLSHVRYYTGSPRGFHD